MSIHYETCARCNKDLVITMSDDYYFSDIDDKVLCKECYEKEQPKELVKQIVDLQSQLAEKDKELKELRFQARNIFPLVENLEDKVNQDKISFAVEQLEKAKEKILSYEEIYYQFLESGAKVPVVCLENFRVRQTIDSQINGLKGEVQE